MANAGTIATARFSNFLLTPAGLSENLAALAEREGVILAPLGVKQVLALNAAHALMERSLELKYPIVLVYCEKIANNLREKFRTFSGKANLTAEVRVSQDRLEGIERLLELHVDAVTRVLDQNRGDWGNGMFYAGGYEATFDAIAHGGRNFLQSGKVRFEIAVSID